MKEHDFEKIMKNVKITDEGREKILNKVREKSKNSQKKAITIRKRFVPIMVGVTLLLGATALATTKSQWSKGFLQSMKISEKQMEDLQKSENNLVSTPNISDTNQDITVSVAQCLCDGNTLKISFFVEGYELEKAKEPQLEYLNVLIDGKEVHNYAWNFFNGIDWSDKNNIIMADGSPAEVDEGGRYIPNYRISDGKMEIDLTVFSPTSDDGKQLTKKDMENKNITVLMQNFGDKKGKWTLEWNLGKLSESKKFTINKMLKNTQIEIKTAVIYPSSATIRFDFSKIKEKGYDENGEFIICSELNETFEFTGVRLKDNTTLTDLYNGGSSGYDSNNKDEFIIRANFSRIIEPNDVTAIIFKNKENEKTTYYEISLK